MGSASIFLKDPKISRFLGGGIAEAESLLGSPLPRLPTPEQEGNRDVFYVNFHPRLRTLARKFVLDLLGQIGIALPGAPSRGDSGRDQAEYEAALARVLRSARSADRRRGLPNLFWLAHTKDIAEHLKELESKAPALRRAKYSLHPLLSSMFRRLDQDARKEMNKEASPALRQRGSGPDRGPPRRRVRVHRGVGQRPRLQPVPGREQALPDHRRGLLRDPGHPPARGGAAGPGRGPDPHDPDRPLHAEPSQGRSTSARPASSRSS